jgi:hypothetical protein
MEKGKTEVVSLRVHPDEMERLMNLVAKLPGTNRAAMAKAAMLRGLTELEREFLNPDKKP